jgi:ribosome-associated translation inhibitor RaiA
MPAEVQISFRGMEPSPSAEAQVRRRVEELQQISDRVSSFRIVLGADHRHHRKGRIYYAHVDLALPGGNIVVSREPGEDHAHEDMHVSIRDAFDTARRRLQDHLRRLDGTQSPPDER